MDFVRGTPREQIALFPEVMEDYISEDNPVRFIDAFVEEMDLTKKGFEGTQHAPTGRPPYHPGDLLKLQIYGYLNKIRSSRSLERETHRNIEVIWLLRKLRPDHKTISDFRKRNRASFKEVAREFSVLCRDMGLFGGELIAIDGSRFKAVNSPDRNFTKGKLKKRLQRLDEIIDSYLDALDQADEEEADDDHQPTKEELEEKVRSLKERKDTYGKLLEDLEESGESQVSLTDPDSRLSAHRIESGVGFNGQIAVDDKHHLIVAQDVTNHIADTQQLSKMAVEAKEVLGVDELEAVADSGYYNGPEIKRCEDEGIQAYVPKIPSSSCASRGLFSKDEFRYDRWRDCYSCPAGEELTRRWIAARSSKGPGREHLRAYYATAACRTCRLRNKCTTNKNGRIIYRWIHEEVLERMEKRVAQNPELLAKRKTIVEHPFGVMKFWNDQSHFLSRGLDNVRGEFSLMTLAYNIKRVIKLVGVSKMVEALRMKAVACLSLAIPQCYYAIKRRLIFA
jgi:transposase